jgi:hypothetical protein
VAMTNAMRRTFHMPTSAAGAPLLVFGGCIEKGVCV